METEVEVKGCQKLNVQGNYEMLSGGMERSNPTKCAF